ncbi:MAG TPA: hypothetical protein VHE55_03500 [Fimbriimonadaceae bacterium]|nr:hypothetical protein [Fimbriimonadaceae bacterium]
MKAGAGVDVDDAAGALLPHRRNNGLHGDDRAEHVEMEDFVEEGRIDLFDRGCVASAGVVDEAVDLAVIRLDLGDGLTDAAEVGHVDGDGEAAGQGCGKVLEDRRAAGHQGYLGAVVGEGLRGRQSDARGSAGHDKNSIVDLHRSFATHFGSIRFGEARSPNSCRLAIWGREKPRLGNLSGIG